MITAKKNQIKREIIPSDNYYAKCIQIIDLGTADYEFMGNVHTQRKIIIGFELMNYEIEDKNYYISQEYTLSLNEKAKLRIHLESWRGKAFTDEELDGFDLQNLLGKNCLVNVIEKISKAGNPYNEISSITKLPPKSPEIITKKEPFILSFEDNPYNYELFNKLPKYIQEKIESSDEWKGMNSTTKETDPEIEEDDIPF